MLSANLCWRGTTHCWSRSNVTCNCLKQLQLISGAAPRRDVRDIQFPDLPPLTLNEVKWLQLGCSWNKGHTPDGFSDTWIRNTESRELLNDLWNNTAIHRMAGVFEARLVPLNKAWPDIPKEDQFRPIVVLSPMFKWLERRFQYKLSRYLSDHLDPHQTGVVSLSLIHI